MVSRPKARLVFDSAGNIYGTTFAGGLQGEFCNPPGEGCGTVFELSPTENGHWVEQIFRFPGDMSLGAQPTSPLTLIESSGEAYGTTSEGGPGLNNGGVVFRFVQ